MKTLRLFTLLLMFGCYRNADPDTLENVPETRVEVGHPAFIIKVEATEVPNRDIVNAKVTFNREIPNNKDGEPHLKYPGARDILELDPIGYAAKTTEMLVQYAPLADKISEPRKLLGSTVCYRIHKK